MSGIEFVIRLLQKNNYFMDNLTKPYLDSHLLLHQLELRGMNCDEKLTMQWLNSVGYYRLSGYWYPYHSIFYENGKKCISETFIDGANFSDVANLYEFDRKLRTLIHDGIERIEVGLRVALVEVLGAQNPLAYERPTYLRENLSIDYKYAYWVKRAAGRVSRSFKYNQSLKHHLKKYKGILPIWTLMEVLDFSDISQLFSNMKRRDQLKVADLLNINFDISNLSKSQRKKVIKVHPLAKWIRQLTIVRNTCAHHSRTWNRTFNPAPGKVFHSVPELRSLEDQSESIYGALVMIAYLLKTLSPKGKWNKHVKDLIERDFEPILGRTVAEMGFPDNWKQEPIWN
ncbi:MAG: Abi family protein [Micrococcaceae bacterium]